MSPMFSLVDVHRMKRTVCKRLLYKISARSKTLNAATASGLPDVTADIFGNNTDNIVADIAVNGSHIGLFSLVPNIF